MQALDIDKKAAIDMTELAISIDRETIELVKNAQTSEEIMEILDKQAAKKLAHSMKLAGEILEASLTVALDTEPEAEAEDKVIEPQVTKRPFTLLN